MSALALEREQSTGRPDHDAPIASCLYVGTIRHRRAEPRREFRHRLTLAYVDLEELPRLLDGRLLAPGPGALRFRRRDYLGGRELPLAAAVAQRLAELGAPEPRGPIRLLTQLRSWGMCFNPVSFYYCFAQDGKTLQTVLAEVTNTPWGERHSYAVAPAPDGSRLLRGTFDKQLHVSPFMGMDHVYETRATTPAQTLSVHIESRRGEQKAFDATLAMERRELTAASARAVTLRYPLATARVLALIYGHAVALKLAGARVYPHPGSQAGGADR